MSQRLNIYSLERKQLEKNAETKGLQIGETVVTFTASACNLGVIIDESLSLHQHIAEI